MSYEMQYSTLGRTGLKVSRIGYGGATLGNMYTPMDEAEAERGVYKCVEEYGINIIDTSPSYGEGYLGEKRLGEILSHGLREKVIVASKAGDYYYGDTKDTAYRDFSAEGIREQTELQLKRLKTDHLDILQLHDIDSANLEQIVNESVPELCRLRQEGKTRYIGITSVHLPSLRYVLERTDEIDVVLEFGRYNLMDKAVVGYFDDLLEKQNFGLMNCSVLFMGMLTKRALTRPKMINHLFLLHPDAYEALEKAIKLCDEHGVDIGDLAVQYGCDCPCCATTFISMGRPERVDQNMALLQRPYDKALAEEVFNILHPHSVIPNQPWIDEFTPLDASVINKARLKR